MKFSGIRLVVCETSLRENFYPLTYTRLGADLLFGTETLLQKIERKFEGPVTDLFVPRYLRELTESTHPDLKVNEAVTQQCVVVNSLISTRREMWNFILKSLDEPGQIVIRDSLGNFVFGKLEESNPDFFRTFGMTKNRKINLLQIPDGLEQYCLIRFPWDLVSRNFSELVSDYSEKKIITLNQTNNFEVLGEKVSISDSSQIDRFVTLDSRAGPVIIDDDVEIQSFSHLTGPCYIGKKSKIKSAKIREGTSIGERCKVAGEVEATIISEYSNKSHDGFLGHSLIGSWVNLGALTTNSDLKNTYGKIRANLGRKSIDTGMIKVGITVADMAKTAIGTIVLAGKKIGVASHVFGTILEDVPSYTMYGKSLGAKSAEITLDSVLSTQKRMMERRSLKITPELEATIRTVYKMTKKERAFQRVSKRRFKLS